MGTPINDSGALEVVAKRTAEVVALGLYVRYLADELCLKDWKIHLEINEGIDDAYATCTVVEGRRVATIALCAPFFDSSQEEQRHSLIHELNHIALHPLRACMNTVERLIGACAYNILTGNHDLQVEHAVDHFADVLSHRDRGLMTPDEWAKRDV